MVDRSREQYAAAARTFAEVHGCDRVELDWKGGTIDRHTGLLGQTDTNGNSLTIDASGIRASSGPTITFNRDAGNRITQIVGPNGIISYTYSPAGDLTGVQYPTGATQAFTYDPAHDLVSTSALRLRCRFVGGDGDAVPVPDYRLFEQDVRINIVRARMVRTESLRATFGQEFESFAERFKLRGQFITSEEVANTILALCSGLLDGISGQVITVDRGASFFDNLMRVYQERDALDV
jgi:YD repeat-containing protein